MRINERPGAAVVGGAGQATRPAATGARFTLGDLAGPTLTGSAQAAAPAGAIAGLLAVQATGDQIERQRRAIGRGKGILDGLDRLKFAMLSGSVSQADLLSLRATLMRQRDGVDDPELQDLLGHIELRAEVELAKLARR